MKKCGVAAYEVLGVESSLGRSKGTSTCYVCKGRWQIQNLSCLSHARTNLRIPPHNQDNVIEGANRGTQEGPA